MNPLESWKKFHRRDPFQDQFFGQFETHFVQREVFKYFAFPLHLKEVDSVYMVSRNFNHSYNMETFLFILFSAIMVLTMISHMYREFVMVVQKIALT